MRTDLVEDALKMAIALRGERPSQVIFHADRGTQYASDQITQFAAHNGITRSMGRTGVCWDNAMAESFFATLKTEFYYRRVWPTKAGAAQAVGAWIEDRYNRRAGDTPRSARSAPLSSNCNTASSPRQNFKPHNPVSTKRGEGQTLKPVRANYTNRLRDIQTRLLHPSRPAPGLTTHQAKGGEWTSVGVCLRETERALLGKGLSVEGDTDRKLYVACTRARFSTVEVVA